MNTGKAPDNDGHTPEVTRFQGSMLPTAPLSIVRVTHHHPLHPLRLREREREREREGGREGGRERERERERGRVRGRGRGRGRERERAKMSIYNSCVPCSIWQCQVQVHTLL